MDEEFKETALNIIVELRDGDTHAEKSEQIVDLMSEAHPYIGWGCVVLPEDKSDVFVIASNC